MASLDVLREAAVSVCWQQWTALGASLSRTSREPVRSVVDLEALILMSLALRGDERRLDDAVAWWAHAASRLVSVQRLRTMARRGPAGAEGHVATFAATASEAGDRRWQHLAAGAAPLPVRRAKGPTQPQLAEPPALMPRLRAAFGVGAKADVLLFLLTAPRPDASARDLAVALDYTPRAVREAAEDMTLAGLIEARGERPRRYSVHRQPWSDLLIQGGKLPAWRSWNATWEFVSHLITWADAPRAQASAYLRASAARDVVEAHARRLDIAHGAPRPPEAAGAAYPAAFEAYIGDLASWIGEAV